MKFIVKLFDLPSQTQIKTEVLSGITVAMALIPEAVAFSLIAGLPPLTGLYAAIVMGLVTSLIGGRPGMISGATGAIAILLVFALVSLFGLDTKTIGDLASIRGSIPPFHLPNLTFSLETLQIILPYAGMVAAVGLIESLLTMNIIDEITQTRGRGNKEALHREQPIFFPVFFPAWAVVP
ncbi:MAG TPA: SulP family inorganic anion transporter [Bacteroidales bacterium]|jgi:MFS superfamily sulfate permease-like transporter|nr:SulP family inorganic anion transporter [Bacteroidales bacterium]